jgi:hypothetical protein
MDEAEKNFLKIRSAAVMRGEPIRPDDGTHTRSNTLSVRTSDAEAAKIRSYAIAHNVSQSQAARELLSGATTVPTCTPGQFVGAMVRAAIGSRAGVWNEDHDLLIRADAQEATTGSGGLLAEDLVGQMITFVDRLRAATASSNGGAGPRPMTLQGSVFKRPRATTRTLAGLQPAEFLGQASRALVATDDEVAKHTIGAALDVSEETADWTTDDGWQGLLNDLGASYAVQAEALTCQAIEGACSNAFGNTLHTSLTASSSTFALAVAAAVEQAFKAAQAPPDTVYASLDRLGYVLGLTDNNGRPVYDNNTPAGLHVVASPFFAPGFIAVACSQFVECYEVRKGLVSYAPPSGWGPARSALSGISVPEPSTLSGRLSFRGYFATLVQPSAIVSLEDVNVGGGSWSS